MRPVGVTRIRKLSAGFPELIEELVDHRFDSGKTLGRSVLQQLLDEFNGVVIGFAEHLERGKNFVFGNNGDDKLWRTDGA